jgi:hypothetical protein
VVPHLGAPMTKKVGRTPADKRKVGFVSNGAHH